MELSHEKRLDIISKAWGKQSGYCFFPWIDGTATNKAERIRGYHEGPAFLWPKDKPKILAHLKEHEPHDLYWCPSLFEGKRRAMEEAMDEHCLWADLDEVDPHEIDEEYKPSVAWETSPGHYQALWLLQPGSGDLQGASWEGNENQRLTYMLGADQSGWDTTQLLRLPEWRNHKPEYRGGTKDGPNPKLSAAPKGKLVWSRGRKYLPDDFNGLPEVARSGLAGVEVLLEDQIEGIDRHEVWGKVRLKVSQRVREAMARRDTAGAGEGNEQGRSGMLWEIERELADAGCTVPEIVAIVRESAWNKFSGRADELKRLTIEATKAIAERSQETEKAIEEDRAPKPEPTKLGLLLKGIKPPRWLIQDLWAEASCGFIAGQPKSFKSWFAMDLALSISSGIAFLDTFAIRRPGPVLYIQEEDSLPQVKYKYDRIWPSKIAGKLVIGEGDEAGTIWEVPASEANDEGPDIDAYVGNGFTVSNEGWQAWLDEMLERGWNNGEDSYRMVIMDPLMMIAGDVEEKASVMTEHVFKPLKQLSRKHEVGFGIVHHMRKGSEKAWTEGVRGGQLMLGSVANHAWSEDSLYLQFNKGKLHVETESKHGITRSFDVTGVKQKGWFPGIEMEALTTIEKEAENANTDKRRRTEAQKQGRVQAKKTRSRNQKAKEIAEDETLTEKQKEVALSEMRRPGRRLSQNPILTLLKQRGKAMTRTEIINSLGIEQSSVWRQLKRLEAAGLVKNDGAERGTRWSIVT